MNKENKVRYAVVGLGWFAQEAILPAFANTKDSELVALVSGDRTKLRELSERYQVEHALTYDQYDDFLESGKVDAVYIALPNSQHCEYTVRAANAKVHVLCEKPMAMDEAECREMIGACAKARAKLMIAYRLHFEKANLGAIEIVSSGQIGEPRLFSSVFTMQVELGNSRLDLDLNAGPLYDIGTYCINASRYIFRAEPCEVTAFCSKNEEDPRFDQVEEQIVALLRFADDRLATFAISFGAHSCSRYEVIGTRGVLTVDPAYSHSGELGYQLQSDGKISKKKFGSRDQIGPEISYFSQCIREDQEPEPSGEEGLADVRVIRALYESAATQRAVRIEPVRKQARPEPAQQSTMRPSREPDLVHAQSPH